MVCGETVMTGQCGWRFSPVDARLELCTRRDMCEEISVARHGFCWSGQAGISKTFFWMCPVWFERASGCAREQVCMSALVKPLLDRMSDMTAMKDKRCAFDLGETEMDGLVTLELKKK